MVSQTQGLSWIADGSEADSRLVLFCVQQVNKVNSCNGFAMMMLP